MKIHSHIHSYTNTLIRIQLLHTLSHTPLHTHTLTHKTLIRTHKHIHTAIPHTLSHIHPPHTLSHRHAHTHTGRHTLTHTLLYMCAYVPTLNFLYSFIRSAEHSRARPMPVTGTAKTPMGWALASLVTLMISSLTVTTCHPDETWSLLTGPAPSLVAQSGLQRPPAPSCDL